MKQFSYLLLGLCMVLAMACSNDDDPDDLMKAREVAWNSLDEETRATVTTDWRGARVDVNEETYLVVFNTTEDPLLGPVGVFVNRTSFQIEGYSPRF